MDGEPKEGAGPREDDAATHILPPELADDATGATQVLPSPPAPRGRRDPQTPEPTREPRARRWGRSVLLLAMGVTTLLPAAVCLYARVNLLDEQRLADTVVRTVDRPEVRKFVAIKAADGIVAGVPSLEPQRSTLEDASSKVVSTDVFQNALRATTAAAEKALLDSGSQATAMQIQNLGSMVRTQVAQVDPALAAQIPTDLGAQLLKLDRSSALPAVLRALDGVRFLGLVLPPIAIALLLASVLVAGERGAASRRLGIALIVWGAACFLLLIWLRSLALGALPTGAERDAAGPAWDEVLGGLRTWVLLVGAVGVALVGAVSWSRRRN